MTLIRRSFSKAFASGSFSLRKRAYSADVINPVDAHPPLQPPADGVRLVTGEIMAGPGPQDGEDLLEGFADFSGDGTNPGAVDRHMSDKLNELLRHFLRR